MKLPFDTRPTSHPTANMPTRSTLCRSLFATLVLSVSPMAQAQDCKADDYSPICTDMRAQAAYEQADGDLNTVYQQVLKRLSQPRNEYIDYPALKTKFTAAQRQWVRFRDSECDAWYGVNQAGTGRNADQMTCLLKRTQQRTQQLQEWQAYLP
ncbi:lysozyme inhibitor LprI family protein [Achromobacter sp. UMC71]|uniref:lysozyme inhibitor LprI family protein n=1 Tax=Achromobacter sp. UMC71 TaxID=1862320 RepID=UPI0016008408|nr:lysozyme inhibitor LprI family protein [Achromobacter sp. UMC71]MBB1627508.1 hypothetical protein [Achromobacter sp. UMC71]